MPDGPSRWDSAKRWGGWLAAIVGAVWLGWAFIVGVADYVDTVRLGTSGETAEAVITDYRGVSEFVSIDVQFLTAQGEAVVANIGVGQYYEGRPGDQVEVHYMPDHAGETATLSPGTDLFVDPIVLFFLFSFAAVCGAYSLSAPPWRPDE